MLITYHRLPYEPTKTLTSNILYKCRDNTSNLHILLSSAVLEVPTIDFIAYTDTDRKTDQQLATFTLQLLLRFEICSVLRKSGMAYCVLVTANTLGSETSSPAESIFILISFLF